MVWQRPIQRSASLVSKCGFTRVMSYRASVVRLVKLRKSLLYSRPWLLAKAVRVVSVVNAFRESEVLVRKVSEVRVRRESEHHGHKVNEHHDRKVSEVRVRRESEHHGHKVNEHHDRK